MLIDHCHDFFPDLPAPPTPSSATSTNKWSSIPSPTSSLWSSFHSYAPSSPRSYESSSLSSTEHLPHPLADNAEDEGVTVHMVNEDTPSPTEKPQSTPMLPPTPPTKPHPSSRLSGGSHSPPMIPKQGVPPYSNSPVPKPRTGSSSSNSSYSTASPNVLHARSSSGELHNSESTIVENGQIDTPSQR